MAMAPLNYFHIKEYKVDAEESWSTYSLHIVSTFLGIEDQVNFIPLLSNTINILVFNTDYLYPIHHRHNI